MSGGTKFEVEINAAQKKSLDDYGFFVWFRLPEDKVPVGHRVHAHVSTGGVPSVSDFTETVIMGKQRLPTGLDAYVCLDVRRLGSAPALELPKTLAEFMRSKIGAQVRAKLKEDKRYILLAESETVTSYSESVSLDGDGLKSSTQVVGMAAAYSKEEPLMRSLDVNEALELICEYRDIDFLNEEDLVKDIVARANLDNAA